MSTAKNGLNERKTERSLSLLSLCAMLFRFCRHNTSYTFFFFLQHQNSVIQSSPCSLLPQALKAMMQKELPIKMDNSQGH